MRESVLVCKHKGGEREKKRERKREREEEAENGIGREGGI